MRVDAVPQLLRPLFHVYGYGFGALLQSVIMSVRHGCRFEWVRRAGTSGPRIDCFWHEHLPAYIASYLPPSPDLPHAWLNHPIWYMRAVHLVLKWNGVDALALGSSGHSGQQALKDIVGFLAQGYSTALAVDGPAGPEHVLKRGALDMAVASGRPIVAIRFEYDRVIRMPSWDRKAFPVLPSRVRVFESGPIYVEASNYELQRATLERALS